MNALFDIIEEDSWRYETRNETVYFDDGMVDIILHVPGLADGSTIAAAAIILSIFSTIVTMTIKEDTGVIRAFNKFISSNVSLILLGLIIATAEDFFREKYPTFFKTGQGMSIFSEVHSFKYQTGRFFNPSSNINGDREDRHHTIDVFAFSSSFLADIRTPILFFSCYNLYNRHFARQIIYIFLYSFCGRFVFLTLTGFLIKNIASQFLEMEFLSYGSAWSFAAISSIVDPLTGFSVFEDTSQKNFFLLLGIYVVGNTIGVEVFTAAFRLAPFKSAQQFEWTTYALLLLSIVLNIVVALLIGTIIGLLTSFLSRFSRNNKSCEFYEPFITVSGPLLTMLLCEWNGRSVIFGVIICCLIQERYVFMNLSTKSVMSVKVAMESLAFLSNLIGFVLIGYKFYRNLVVFSEI